jgi:hypothetical protein
MMDNIEYLNRALDMTEQSVGRRPAARVFQFPKSAMNLPKRLLREGEALRPNCGVSSIGGTTCNAINPYYGDYSYCANECRDDDGILVQVYTPEQQAELSLCTSAEEYDRIKRDFPELVIDEALA